MSKCFKVVEEWDGEISGWVLKISHQLKAIEEVGVPVFYENDDGLGETEYFIKLHRCKLCGMVIISKEKAHED